MHKNAHDVSLEDKTRIEDEKIIDLFEIFKEVQPILDLIIAPISTIETMQQSQVEKAKMINIIMYIHTEDKKVILEVSLDV